MTHSDGVVTMEIIDCKPEDSGKYRCVATNIHGKDETSCVVIVEGNSEEIQFLLSVVSNIYNIYCYFTFLSLFLFTFIHLLYYIFYKIFIYNIKNFFTGTGETEEQVKLAHDLLHSGGKKCNPCYF